MLASSNFSEAARDYPHNTAESVECPSCHYVTGANIPGWATHVPLDIDDSKYNNLCWSCHTGSAGDPPLAYTHSSLMTDNSYGDWSIECRTCHNPHKQMQTLTYGSASYVETGTSTGKTNTALTDTSKNWTADQFANMVLIPDTALTYMYQVTGNDSNTITIDGTMDTSVTAGKAYAVIKGKLIKSTINAPNRATCSIVANQYICTSTTAKTTRFFRDTGTNSFADGDSIYDGICEVCHTQTIFHKSNGQSGSHPSGVKCTMCHPHTEGLGAIAGMNECTSCHKSAMGSRRQVVDGNGDGTGTGGDFKKSSHHVYPSSGTVTSSDCVVCHDITYHSSGVVRLKNIDTGEVYSYNPANPSTAEPHCLSCHDANGASGDMSPFSDGKNLGTVPYKAGKDITASWGKTYGHRRQGLTCIGNGNPNTGCHYGGHGSDYKGLLAKNLALPLTPAGQGSPYRTDDEAAYELCFNCHSNYARVTKEAILGVKAGSKYDWDHWWGVMPPYYTASTQTNFKDRYDASGKSYDDQEGWRGAGEYYNLHFFHIQDGGGNGWKYRDSISSNIHCLTCHNVHGSNTQWGWVYDEMQYNHYDGQNGDKYGRIGMPNLNNMNNYPISCAYNCHPITGVLDNWFEPAGE
jgi:hypothetical protein